MDMGVENGSHLFTLAVLRVICLLQYLIYLEVELLDQSSLSEPHPLLRRSEGGREGGLQQGAWVGDEGDKGRGGWREIITIQGGQTRQEQVQLLSLCCSLYHSLQFLWSSKNILMCVVATLVSTH